MTLSALALLLLTTAPSSAQDMDDFIDDDEIDFEDEVPSEPEARSEAAEASKDDEQERPELFDDETDEDLNFEDDVLEEGEEALEDDGGLDLDDEVVRRKEGEDDADIFRAQQQSVQDFPPDEEVMSWEAYLETYPASVFRERIDERITELMKLQQRARIDIADDRVDAQDQEIVLVQALGFSNVNPRTRATVGIDFGIPNFVGGQFDFEYAFMREFSAHAGVNRKFSGWGLDVGARWAFVKSTKAQLVSSLSLDTRVGLPGGISSVHARFLPAWSIGKRFGSVQLLAQLGADIETRPGATVGVFGGMHVTYRAAPTVGIFVETNAYLRNLGRVVPLEGGGAGIFTFDQIGFGLKFYPGMRNRNDDPLELTAGANMPFYRNYLGYYEGAVSAQAVFYPGMSGTGSQR